MDYDAIKKEQRMKLESAFSIEAPKEKVQEGHGAARRKWTLQLHQNPRLSIKGMCYIFAFQNLIAHSIQTPCKHYKEWQNQGVRARNNSKSTNEKEKPMANKV